MKVSQIVVPACALWTLACGGAADAPPSSASRTADSVLFAIDLWPGEGIPVIELQRPELRLRARPDPAAPVVDTLRGHIGQRVVFDSTRYQTISSGTITTRQPLAVSGRDLGTVARVTREQYYRPNVEEITVPVTAPAIELLQHRAEGTCFVRIDRRVIDARPCPGLGRDGAVVVRQPVTRWWVLMRGSSGNPGWALVSDTTARVVRREF